MSYSNSNQAKKTISQSDQSQTEACISRILKDTEVTIVPVFRQPVPEPHQYLKYKNPVVSGRKDALPHQYFLRNKAKQQS